MKRTNKVRRGLLENDNFDAKSFDRSVSEKIKNACKKLGFTTLEIKNKPLNIKKEYVNQIAHMTGLRSLKIEEVINQSGSNNVHNESINKAVKLVESITGKKIMLKESPTDDSTGENDYDPSFDFLKPSILLILEIEIKEFEKAMARASRKLSELDEDDYNSFAGDDTINRKLDDVMNSIEHLRSYLK